MCFIDNTKIQHPRGAFSVFCRLLHVDAEFFRKIFHDVRGKDLGGGFHAHPFQFLTIGFSNPPYERKVISI